jgi:hypothetical protein
MSDERPNADDGDRSAAATEESARGDASSDEASRDGPAEGASEEADSPDVERDPARRDEDGGGISDRVALLVSLLFGFALAVGSVLLVGQLDSGVEGLLRIRPTVAGGGVGAGWQAGNADAALNLMITLVHLADIVMGLFILVMVFVHWATFRRLAARMKPPGGRPGERGTAATDGGERGERRSSDPRSDEPGDGGGDGA